MLKVGQIVYAKVIAIDTEKRRISLSLRDTMEYTEDADAETTDAAADASEGEYYFQTESAPNQDVELNKEKEEMLEEGGHKSDDKDLAEATMERDRVAGAREAYEGHYDSEAEKVEESEKPVEEGDQDYYLEDAEGEHEDHALADEADKTAKEGAEKAEAADEIGKATADRDEKADSDKLACDAYLQNAECE